MPPQIYKDNELNFDNIVGLDYVKHIIRTRFEKDEKVRQKMKRLGVENLIRMPNDMLLYGPPGVGKTLIGKTVLKEINRIYPKIIIEEVDVHQLMDSNVGETSKKVHRFFNEKRIEALKQDTRCILLIDEIETLIPKRTVNRSLSQERTSAWLRERGGIYDTVDIIYVIATTNLPHLIDLAALSRFGDIIRVDLPGTDERRQLAEMYLKPIGMLRNTITGEGIIDISEVVDRTNGYSGREFNRLAAKFIADTIDVEMSLDGVILMINDGINMTLDKVLMDIARFEVEYAKMEKHGEKMQTSDQNESAKAYMDRMNKLKKEDLDMDRMSKLRKEDLDK